MSDSMPYETWFNGDPIRQIAAGTYDMYRDQLAKKFTDEEMAGFDILNKEAKKEHEAAKEKRTKKTVAKKAK